MPVSLRMRPLHYRAVNAQSRRFAPATAVLLALAGMTLMGCTTPPSPSTTPPDSLPATSLTAAPSAEQAEALADGAVTFEEYQAGFERFSQCAGAEGHAITYVSTTGQVIDYAMDPTSADAPEVQRCYQREFEGVDIAWQVSQDDKSETSHQMASCLEQWNLPVPDRMADRMQALEAEGIDFLTCEKA